MLGGYDPKRLQMMHLDVLQSHQPVQHIVEPNVWSCGPLATGAGPGLLEPPKPAVISHVTPMSLGVRRFNGAAATCKRESV